MCPYRKKHNFYIVKQDQHLILKEIMNLHTKRQKPVVAEIHPSSLQFSVHPSGQPS